MNDLGQDHNANDFCCFHPGEVVTGVCALCLKEKLLVLASKQGRGSGALPEEGHRWSSWALSKKPAVDIPRMFALGSLFRLDFQHQNPSSRGGDSDEDSSESLNDSFISIQFEDDGQASWDKKVSNPDENSAAGSWCQTPPKATAEARSMIDHAKRPPRGGMRWRRRVGHLLLRLPRWKPRMSKASVCNVGLAGNGEGAEGWRGWARRRRTT